jgi:hypothetical protein
VVDLAFASIVNAATGLQHLRFTDVVFEKSEEHIPILLPSLLSLTIAHVESSTAECICTAIQTPALTSLSLHSFSLDLTHILWQDRRSPRYPNLRTLSLSSTTLFFRDRFEYTIAVPLLTHLLIDGNMHFPCFKEYTSPTWPQLKTLTVTNLNNISRQLLHSRISAMAEEGYPVDEVFLQDSEFTHAEFIDRLRRITKVGVIQEESSIWLGDFYRSY